MKRFLLTAVTFLALTTAAVAGVGTLGIYADSEAGTRCITDVGGGASLTFYVVHRLNPGDGALVSDFRIVPPVSASWTYVAFFTPFPFTGEAHTGISVGYGGCQTATFVVGSVQWLSNVASSPCGVVAIANGGSGQITVVDCDYGEYAVTSPDYTVVNPTPPCGCPGALATVPSTWGSVKALYR